jgi:ssDNA-binding replication factor A large subunit
MIKIPYDTIIKKILEKSGQSVGEIEEKIKEKMDSLAGLVSKEGAAHIIANELGIKLFENETGRLKVKNLLAGMRNVEVTGRVLEIFPVREFQRGESTGKVGSFLLADETGRTRIVLWGSQTDKLLELEKNMVVKVQFAYVKENQGRKEIHFRDNSNLVLNPPDEVVGEVQQGFIRKKLSDLAEGDSDIEIAGVVVQVFEPKFFEVCPHCNRRIREKEGRLSCDTHGGVDPAYSYVGSIFLDDGTDSIRTVFFSNQLQSLTGKSHEELSTLREKPEDFEKIKQELLGKSSKVTGKIKKNQFFERLEFMAQQVRDVDPREEIARLQKEQGVTTAQEADADVTEEIEVKQPEV